MKVYVNERVDSEVVTHGGPFASKAEAHAFIQSFYDTMPPGKYPILYQSQTATREYKKEHG